MNGQLERVVVIPEQECWELLGSQRVGRVALTVNALPAVLATSYRILNRDTLAFYTSLGPRLRSALRQSVVAFETDHIDPDEQAGWTVVAIGTAVEVSDPAAAEEAERAGLRTWDAYERSQLIWLRPEIVTGRRWGRPEG